MNRVDIVPTILDLLELEHDYSMFEGVNLFRKDEDRVIVVEDIAHGYDKLTVIQGEMKYLIAPGIKCSGSLIYLKIHMKISLKHLKLMKLRNCVPS